LYFFNHREKIKAESSRLIRKLLYSKPLVFNYWNRRIISYSWCGQLKAYCAYLKHKHSIPRLHFQKLKC